MIALQIYDVKQFMSGLLVHTMFDQYLLTELNLFTSCSFEINGKRNKEWYSTDELEQMEEKEYIPWSEIKPIVYAIVKGNKTPSSFKIVFHMKQQEKERVLQQYGMKVQPDTVSGLFLNLKYEKDLLTVITGVSQTIFTLDKSVEQMWDDYVRAYLKGCKIAFEEI